MNYIHGDTADILTVTVPLVLGWIVTTWIKVNGKGKKQKQADEGGKMTNERRMSGSEADKANMKILDRW